MKLSPILSVPSVANPSAVSFAPSRLCESPILRAENDKTLAIMSARFFTNAGFSSLAPTRTSPKRNTFALVRKIFSSQGKNRHVATRDFTATYNDAPKRTCKSANAKYPEPRETKRFASVPAKSTGQNSVVSKHACISGHPQKWSQFQSQFITMHRDSNIGTPFSYAVSVTLLTTTSPVDLATSVYSPRLANGTQRKGSEPMKRIFSSAIAPIAIVAIAALANSTAHAATILKLNLGDVGPDIAPGYSTFATGNDGNAATLGKQDTDVEFTGFLDGLFPDISTGNASFSCCGLLMAHPIATSTSGGLLVYPFSTPPPAANLSEFTLYAPDNTLLLSGQITQGTLIGPMGPPGTGTFFTSVLQKVSGGTLAPYLAPNSISLSFALTNVKTGVIPFPPYQGDPSGQGFGLWTPEGTDLVPFTADASVTISADPVPEPATLGLLVLGAMIATPQVRRTRR